MNKKQFYECVYEEVLKPYEKSKGRLSIFDRIWCLVFSPEGNAVYLIRKKEYL